MPTDSALRILTRMGYVEYVEEMEYASRLRFIIERDELYRINNLPQEYETLINALLRNYSALFTDYVFIDERYLSRVTKLTRHRMYEILVSLSQKRIIDYSPSKKCSIVTFSRQRVLGEELRFATEVYDERKRAFEERINSILEYATTNSRCRSAVLLEYFNEKNSHTCGLCDVCIARQGGSSADGIDDDVATILALLADGKEHAPDEFQRLALTRKRLQVALRMLCDEEKISIIEGKVILKK